MPSPYGYALQGLGDVAGAALGAQAQRRAGDQLTDALANQMRVRQAVQAGIAAQYAPYQQVGYGSLMSLGALAGQRAGQMQPPQGRSFLASSPAYGPTYQGPQGGGYPLAALGSGAAAPDWSAMEQATRQAQSGLGSYGVGEMPGQATSGARMQLTGGRKGDLRLQGPEETAYAEQWLAANPGRAFTDADLHDYRNEQTARAMGLTSAQWNALSPRDQKALLSDARRMGRGR